ncbi:unnamed protein product, partial [Schistocephalus solidus]|uniref:C2H2-type domain-containing protein n=1 Tax=Schistocephalus solidus TaxID=70667 RepID=A0A183T940_SCHSO
EDVQGRRLDDTPLRSGNPDRLLEPSHEAESILSQLPPQNTEAEMARQDPGHGSPGADRNPQHPCHAEASATAMERPTDVTTGVRRQGGQQRRYKDTLKKSLKQLQINSATWEDLAKDRRAWRRSLKTGSAIYEANRIAAAKAKRAARKSPAPHTNTANAQDLPICPRCQSIFRARIGLTTSQYSSPVTSTTATTTAFAFTTTTTTISVGDSLRNCHQCDRTFTSRIGLVGHLRIHRTETGEPVPGAPIYSSDRRLQCPHCPRAFTHRMGLFGHMCIHDSGIHRNADNTDTPCTPSASAIHSSPDTPTTRNDNLPASTDFSCPHCARNFNSRIGLVGHLRIHRTEAGELVPGAPAYSRRTGLH